MELKSVYSRLDNTHHQKRNYLNCCFSVSSENWCANSVWCRWKITCHFCIALNQHETCAWRKKNGKNSDWICYVCTPLAINIFMQFDANNRIFILMSICFSWKSRDMLQKDQSTKLQLQILALLWFAIVSFCSVIT